jgi:glycosyltransferase involved in cell wall biosynthesis
MKILLVNWSQFPSGGDYTYLKQISEIYEKNGHEVVTLSLDRGRGVNLAPVGKYNYFIPDINFPELLRNFSSKTVAQTSLRLILGSSNDILKRIASEHNIDIVHLNNILPYFQVQSFFTFFKSARFFWSLHDYALICPAINLYNNGPCEKCISGSISNCVKLKCKRDSTVASFATWLYYTLSVDRKLISERIEKFLCPSEFLMNKFIEAGFPPSKLLVSNLPYSFSSDSLNSKERDPKKLLFVGRLESYKGVRELVQAFRSSELEEYSLTICGDGSLKEFVEESAKVSKNIHFLGKVSPKVMPDVYRSHSALIVPSTWYENYPFVVLEAVNQGLYIIASDIGGLSEMTGFGKHGTLFEAGDVSSLTSAILSYGVSGSSEKVTLSLESLKERCDSGVQEVFYQQLIH